MDGRARDARRPFDLGDTTVANRLRFGRRPQAPRSLGACPLVDVVDARARDVDEAMFDVE